MEGGLHTLASKIAEITENLVTPILRDLELELVDIEFVKEGKNKYLRVYIDSDHGVDLDSCTAVSERLSEALDEHDPIKEAYFLEVSSPGAERPLKKLKDFEKAVGKHVRITTYEPIKGEKVFEGKLIHVTPDAITIDVRFKTKTIETEIPFEKIASSRLAIVFN